MMMENGFSDINKIYRPWLAALAVVGILASGCNNTVGGRGPSAETTAATRQAGLPGLGGGTLPTGSSVLPITLSNAVPSVSSSDSLALDIIGQSDELGTFCPTATDCICHLDWTDPTSNTADGHDAPITHNEINLLRCSYDQVPDNVETFTVSVRVFSGGLSSNKIILRFPHADSAKQTDNANNYLKVTRYQCKDIVTRNTSFYQNNSLLDPQAWQMSLSFNLYTTSMGVDYGGATQGYECPVTPTDETVVQYARDRYWPYAGPTALSNGGKAAGPAGIDGDCGDTTPGAGMKRFCDCPGGSTNSTLNTFDGFGTAATGCVSNTYTSDQTYDSQSRIFGVSRDALNNESFTNGLIEGEPYDMTIWSTKPLKGDPALPNADNVIYPVNIDEGTKSSYGINNNKSATFSGTNDCDGTDSTLCKCVTGLEKECRRYTQNRHDFYVSNFLDNTFKYPFCVAHSVGGATANNSLQVNGLLDCAPEPRGKDVLGFVALPNGSGACPNVKLPKGKKWGQLWHFRVSIQPRKMIDIANAGDIGDLYCTGPAKECTGTIRSLSRFNVTGDISGHTLSTDTNDLRGGAKYCQYGSNSKNTVPTGAVTNFSNRGQRFGNCLQKTGMPDNTFHTVWTNWRDATTGNFVANPLVSDFCEYTDGFAPFLLNGTRPAWALSENVVGGSLRLTNLVDPGILNDVLDPRPIDGGCFDPALLYNQPFTSTNASARVGAGTFAGFMNLFDPTASILTQLISAATGGRGCMSWDDALESGTTDASGTLVNPIEVGFKTTSNFSTFDWQGFPFIAGNFTSNEPANTSSTGINPVIDNTGVGFGGNVCNPTLPGSRWTGTHDSGWTFASGQTLTAPYSGMPGWQDGKDVWLVGSSGKGACIEADINNEGLLYNPYAHPFEMPFIGRLPGSALIVGGQTSGYGFPGAVSAFPKTIKNWFDFVGIGCNGKCDNSSAANSYPSFPWIAGKIFSRGTAGTVTSGFGPEAVPDRAIRTGPHSSTDSWGGYGIFRFTTVDIDSASRSDNLYIVSPTNISKDQMINDDDIQSQYRPVRYINGARLEYELVRDSQNTGNPSERLPVFPMCVLQDKSLPQDDLGP